MHLQRLGGRGWGSAVPQCRGERVDTDRAPDLAGEAGQLEPLLGCEPLSTVRVIGAVVGNLADTPPELECAEDADAHALTVRARRRRVCPRSAL